MHSGDVVDGRFRLERLIGSGSAAHVHRAIDLASGETVALKITRAVEGELATRFAREVRILEQIVHPALVRHVASGRTPEGNLYVAMEWLPGEDLRARMRRARLSTYEAIEVVRRAAQGLAAVHAAGIVHRDVKPSNLYLVNGDCEQTKVIDFGMARAPELLGLATETGVLLGTPAYMAPEQVRSARSADARSDVFSLGCVLYECLTEQRAFSGGSVHEILERIVHRPLTSTSVFADVPSELDAIVKRMTAKDPAARPRDGAEVAALLDRVRIDRTSGPVASRITRDEQRIVCVLVARAGAGDPPLAGSASWASVAQASQGEVIARPDGTMAAAFRGANPPIDLAARAARSALALVRATPGATVVISMGRETQAPGGAGEGTLSIAEKRLGAATQAPSSGAGVVRVDEVTAGLLEVRFDLGRDAAGPFVRGERAASHAARVILGKATPCVGRDRELRQLAESFDECAVESIARAVVVTGPAGIGKSRVRFEMLREASARADVWMGRGDPARAGSPLSLLADVLRSVAGVRDGDSGESTLGLLRARVARAVAPTEAARVSEFLSEIVAPSPFSSTTGHASPQLRAARKNPQLMGDQMQRAWLDFVAAESARRPIVIVLEDLHWGDALTVRFVDLALRAVADRPLFVLAMARPDVHEVFPRLWDGRDVQEVRLRELTAKASEQLVREALGDVDAKVVEQMVAHAGGNAFYLEECVRAAAEGDAEFPATVIAMVEARLDRLEAEARQVLRAASVFGQTFWRRGVEALLGGDKRTNIGSWLDLLEDREWIARRPSGKLKSEEEYTFRHALMREGAYAMLTDDDRATGHALAGSWLEEAGEPDAAVLADHFERGKKADRAAHAWERAALDALRRNDLEATVACAERGLRGWPADRGARARLHWAAAHALWWRGSLADVVQHALDAANGLPPASAERWEAIGILVGALTQLARHDDAAPWIDALAGAKDGGDRPTAAQLVATCGACISLLTSGRPDSAGRLFRAIDARRASCRDADAVLDGHLHRTRGAWALYVTGDLGAFLREVEEARASFDAIGDARNACSAEANAGLAYLMLGAFPLAETTLRSALAGADRVGIDRMRAVTEHNLGIAVARQGRTEDAIALELHAIEELRARRDRRVEGGAWAYVAQMRLETGDVAGAEVAAALAVEVLASFAPIRALALAVQARVHLARGDAPGDVRAALASASAARAILADLGELPGGEELVRLVHVEALEAAGRTDDARAALVEAHARLLARADRIADPAWKASFLESVPENAAIRARMGRALTG